MRLERLLGDRGIIAARRLEFGTVDGILGCASAGLGITLMPRGVASRAAGKGEIGIHSLPKNEAFVPTVCVRRRDAAASAALVRFLECTRSYREAAGVLGGPGTFKRTKQRYQ